MPIPRSERNPNRQITDHKDIARILLLMGFFQVKPVQPTSIIALKDSSLSGARMQANAPSQTDIPAPEVVPAETAQTDANTTGYSTPLTPPGGELNTPPGEGAT